MNHNVLNRLNLAPTTRQGHLLVKAGSIITGLACALHLVLGANPIVVCAAGLTVLLSIYPLALYGFLNIGAVLIALVGFRYVGFPLVAKLAMGQALNTNLMDPLGSFGVVLLGVSGYLAALLLASNRSVGRPFLQPAANNAELGRISFLAAVIGIAANLAVAFRSGDQHSGITIANFFVPFLHLALISGIARAIQTSQRRRSVDAWVVFLLVAEIVFAMVLNSRMVLMETLLCFIVTGIAFEAKIKWRQFVVTVTAVGMMVVFFTPVFLYVRGSRGDRSWTRQIDVTLEAVAKWPDAFAYYTDYRELLDRQGWFLNYYGSPRNALERMSFLNHVDVLKAGGDSRGGVGFEDLRLSLERAMPRILAPDKPRGYSQGQWLYARMGRIPFLMGGYSTAPLIGTGYAAFGWLGALFYPFFLGLAFLLIVKKISGWNLEGNIWAIYLLLRVHNQFVEGSSATYVVYILRIFPQDLILLWIVAAMAKRQFLDRLRVSGAQVYGK